MVRSQLDEKTRSIVLDLDAKGWSPKRIADHLAEKDIRTRKDKTPTRDHVRDYLRYNPDKRKKESPPTPTPTPTPKRAGGNGGTEGTAVIEPEVIADRITRRQALPGSPTTTQQERGQLYRWLKQLLGPLVKDIVIQTEEGISMVRCETCGQHDAIRLDRLTRALTRADRLLRNAEQAEDAAPRATLTVTTIQGRTGPGDAPPGAPSLPDPGDNPMPPIFTQEAKAYIEELGGTWEKLLDRVRGEENNEERDDSG